MKNNLRLDKKPNSNSSDESIATPNKYGASWNMDDARRPGRDQKNAL